MAIIVEDGSVVVGANSYVSVADVVAFAAQRGTSLDAATVEPLIVRAFDYIESFEDKFQGVRTLVEQTTAWPRTGVVYVKIPLPDTTVPAAIQRAQCYAAMAINAGFDPQANISARQFVTERTVGPITTKFSDIGKEYGAAGLLPTLPAVDALLAPFFEKETNTFVLKTVRA